MFAPEFPYLIDQYGPRLWRCDGTPDGTWLLPTLQITPRAPRRMVGERQAIVVATRGDGEPRALRSAGLWRAELATDTGARPPTQRRPPRPARSASRRRADLDDLGRREARPRAMGRPAAGAQFDRDLRGWVRVGRPWPMVAAPGIAAADRSRLRSDLADGAGALSSASLPRAPGPTAGGKRTRAAERSSAPSSLLANEPSVPAGAPGRRHRETAQAGDRSRLSTACGGTGIAPHRVAVLWLLDQRRLPREHPRPVGADAAGERRRRDGQR